jgi:putative oxidoreductase
LGLFTRPAALLASVYLLMSMLLGGHFNIGYVWALPDGGYEFGVFWAAMIAVFAVLGGGRNSVDSELWRSEWARRLLPSVVWKVLASDGLRQNGAFSKPVTRSAQPATGACS